MLFHLILLMQFAIWLQSQTCYEHTVLLVYSPNRCTATTDLIGYNVFMLHPKLFYKAYNFNRKINRLGRQLIISHNLLRRFIMCQH